jgi:CRP-like cAMP-binding protein
MPQTTLALLDGKWSNMTLLQGQTCFSVGDPIHRVYFPTSALISLVVATERGELVESGMVGREGAVGLQAAFGPRTSYTRAIVQVSGTCYTIAADTLREAIHRSEEAQAQVIHYIEMLWAEAQQLAACNAVHDASARLARWLLQCVDHSGSKDVRLTHEFLGQMLGLRRTTVTLLARDLQIQGIIACGRGRVTIANRTALESCTCECYRAISDLHRDRRGS